MINMSDKKSNETNLPPLSSTLVVNSPIRERQNQNVNQNSNTTQNMPLVNTVITQILNHQLTSQESVSSANENYLVLPFNQYASYLSKTPTNFKQSYVKLKSLLFYEHITFMTPPALLVPCTAKNIQDARVQFSLDEQKLMYIQNFVQINMPGGCLKHDSEYRILLRFCLCDYFTEQEDLYPKDAVLKINNRSIILNNWRKNVGTKKKFVYPPIDITNDVCMLLSNDLNISWSNAKNRKFVMFMALVKKLKSNDLVKVLQERCVRAESNTRNFIMSSLSDADTDISTTMLKFSLLCPLGKKRMKIPCRGLSCTHLQCFDALTYLQLNEHIETWLCPICCKPTPFSELSIDGYFVNTLNSTLLPSDASEVQLLSNGFWSTHNVPKIPLASRGINSSHPRKSNISHTIDLTADSDMESEDMAIGY